MKDEILKKLYILMQHWQDWDIPQKYKHEINPWLDLWSRDNYLYFTLPVALNFQRSSPAMWRSALDTRND